MIEQEVDENVYDHNVIRTQIEKMPKFNQIEILRILTRHKDVIVNENKNGIHINLRGISNAILQEITYYIKYVNTQEIELNNIEHEKEQYKNTFFLKDNKDKTPNVNKYVS